LEKEQVLTITKLDTRNSVASSSATCGTAFNGSIGRRDPVWQSATSATGIVSVTALIGEVVVCSLICRCEDSSTSRVWVRVVTVLLTRTAEIVGLGAIAVEVVEEETGLSSWGSHGGTCIVS